mgnify:CR=1 FL=1
MPSAYGPYLCTLPVQLVNLQLGHVKGEDGSDEVDISLSEGKTESKASLKILAY